SARATATSGYARTTSRRTAAPITASTRIIRSTRSSTADSTPSSPTCSAWTASAAFKSSNRRDAIRTTHVNHRNAAGAGLDSAHPRRRVRDDRAAAARDAPFPLRAAVLPQHVALLARRRRPVSLAEDTRSIFERVWPAVATGAFRHVGARADSWIRYARLV